MRGVIRTIGLVTVREEYAEVVADDHNGKVLPEAQRVEEILGTFNLYFDLVCLIKFMSLVMVMINLLIAVYVTL